MLNALVTMLDEFSGEPLSLEPQRYGKVAACDGILLEVTGLSVPVGALCTIARGKQNDLTGEVIGFRNGRTLMTLLNDTVLLRPGAIVRPKGQPGMLPVGEGFLGRVVDGCGVPIDGGPPIRALHNWPALGRQSGALDRSSVHEPMDCGIRAINAFTTLGIGQRVGVIAGSGVGKSVMIDMITQSAKADIVILGLIGERAREVSDFVGRHMEGDAAKRMATVAVPADHAPNLRLRGAMLATCLAEYFRYQGKNVLLIMDSLTRIAHAAREIALLLGEPGSARGYPPSALNTITRLVERAGNSAASGGAITGLYTVLADSDDHNDPVVDTARAIMDGHIILSREIAQRGRYPAIDIPASLSRVMDDIVPGNIQQAARNIRRAISIYDANRDLVMMGAYQAGRDAELDRAMALHDQIEAFLMQNRDEAVTLQSSMLQLQELARHDQG